MNRLYLAFTLVFCFMAVSFPAALADGGISSSGSSPNNAGPLPSPGSSSSPGVLPASPGSDAKFGPAMMAGVCVGIVIGTPVCFFRRFRHDAVRGAHGIVGDTDSPVLLGAATAAWIPLAAFTATMEAPVYAVRNSWMAEKPFSKEQFSLGDMPSYD